MCPGVNTFQHLEILFQPIYGCHGSLLALGGVCGEKKSILQKVQSTLKTALTLGPVISRRTYGARGISGGKKFSVDLMASPSENHKESSRGWNKAITSAMESYTLLEKQPLACYWSRLMMEC